MAPPKLDQTMLILLGDGGDPETFGWPCGANARSVKFINNTGEESILDCDDPNGEPAVILRWIESQDTQLTISGRVAVEALSMWRSWADAEDNGGVKNIRSEIQNGSGGAGGFHTLPAILQDFEISREGKASSTFTATIVAAGKRVWTAAT
ncbi:MAG: phage tail protein [Rhodobacteraceae bacterium]|nr:phage tail protein [Paracoccaceae bacterium]